MVTLIKGEVLSPEICSGGGMGSYGANWNVCRSGIRLFKVWMVAECQIIKYAVKLV